MDGHRRSLAFLRSETYLEASGKLWRRPADGLVPVPRAPLERFLKAKGHEPLRTWLSGLAERLRLSGAAELMAKAEEWYFEAVEELLADPKVKDAEGDYFMAWLRECHREAGEYGVYGFS